MSSSLKEGLSADRLLNALVSELNAYKLYLDLELIFDSKDDFLYRQKGQLKLDNSVIEEFAPWLCNSVLMPEIAGKGVSVGPVSAFSGMFFESSLCHVQPGGGLRVRTKDQDFAICRPLWVKTAHTADFANPSEAMTNLAYVATEIKTNLDKTMFQEATGTARDVKMAVPGAKYFLMCDWLDMTPINTRNTPIDEILILRKAKRIPANKRKRYNSYAGRKADRDWFRKYLIANPYAEDVIGRFVTHVRSLLTDEDMDETKVLELGYF